MISQTWQLARRGTKPLALRIAVCIALIVPMTGCPSGVSTTKLNQAQKDYKAGYYERAETAAREVMAKTSGPTRAEAAYIAGLSRFQLGHMLEAETNFLIAAESKDPQVVARAKSMLGLIRLQQRRPMEAATLFAEARPALKDEDARQLARFAAIADQMSGKPGAAAAWTAPAAPFGSTSGGPSFALQVGAFRELDRAQQAAGDARKIVDPQGLGPVRIVNSTDERGRKLYLVQFGSFDSRTAAAGARQRIGKLQYIVTPTGS